MRQGWKVKKIGDVCDVFSGSTPLRSKKEFWEKGTVNWFTIDDIRTQGRKIFNTKQKITTEALENTSIKLLPKKTILLCCTASVGEYSITEVELTTNQQFNGLVIKDRREVHPEFLFYFCSTLKDKLLGLSGKTTIDFVSMTKVKEIDILLPTLSEQKRIVEILDQAFAAIDKAKANVEKNLQNAKDLFEAYLQNVFANKEDDWEEKRIGDVVKSVEYGSSAKSKSQGKVPVLRMGNIQNRRFDWSDLVFTDNEEEIKKYQLKYNDVLFNRTNSAELVGKTAIYKGEQSAIFAGYLIRLNRKEDLIDGDFLNYYLNSKKVRQYGFSVMTSSVNQANINGSKLKEYPIIVPPMKTQKLIVSHLDNLLERTNKLENVYSEKLNILKELKKSVLQKAFTGELTEATKTLIA